MYVLYYGIWYICYFYRDRELYIFKELIKVYVMDLEIVYVK